MAEGVSFDHVVETPRGPFQVFQAELKVLPSPISEMLETYSGIPLGRQREHITRVRDEAFRSHPYPCLGRWRFLELDLSNHPLYASYILPTLSKGTVENGLYLDLGCCLGQDIRKLLFDGAVAERIYGADLRPEFIEAGYALFKDAIPKDHFISPADVFDFAGDSQLAKQCDGKVTILHSCAVFHLFGWDQQVLMAKRCLQLIDLSGRVPGSASGTDPGVGTGGTRRLVCGAQLGNIRPGNYPRFNGLGGERYRHDETTWKKMWEEVVAAEEWKDKIKGVEVGAVMVETGRGRRQETVSTTSADELALQEEAEEVKRLGKTFEGYRWMQFWVWVDFA